MYICAFTKNVYYKNLYLLIDTKQTKKCTYTHTHICMHLSYTYMYVSIEQSNEISLLASRVRKSKD